MAPRPEIPEATIESLIAAGEARWQRFRERRGPAFHAFVPADWRAAARILMALRADADSFLELGSGVGVVTILASLGGYDAAGIEIEPELVAAAIEIAAEFSAGAQFVHGSYIPAVFQSTVDQHATEIPTILDGAPAYAELGAELVDFDLVYAFPWPGLDELYVELMAAHGRPGALLLTFGGAEGFRLYRDGCESPLPA